MKKRVHFVDWVWLVLVLGAGCAQTPQHASFPLTTPAALCQDDRLGPGGFCMPTVRLETLLRDRPMNILEAVHSAHGTTSPLRMVLEFPGEGLIIRAKWKKAHHAAGGVNNNPRKELAAAALQKLFLDEQEYVVPPTVARCVPVEAYELAVHHEGPTFDATRCVFGVLAYWVEHVRELGDLDKQRFETSADYRAALVNLNLLTYLIAHGDTRKSNFIISNDPDHPHALSVDNGLSFGGLANPRTLILGEWRKIVVPKIARRKIDRLRQITRSELDTLEVVAQFEVEDGQMIPIPSTAVIDPKIGVRRVNQVIQLGLTSSEIDGVEKRLRALLKAVDEGAVKVY